MPLSFAKSNNKLYHYTTWEGLHGILTNKSLWATHCEFLSDYSEIILFKPKLIEFLRPYLRKEFPGMTEGELDTVAKPYVELLYDELGKEFYIASFCDEHDEYINKNGLLSQWRGYGKDGGFALVFNVQKLDAILQLEADRFSQLLMLAKLVYSDDDEKYKSELSAPMHEIAEYIIEARRLNMEQKKGGAPSAENPPPAFVQREGKVIRAFVQCVSRYKDQGFKEENEVRVVAWPQPQIQGAVQDKQDKERKFCKKNGEYVPYIELFNSPDIVLPIEKIIVGPHKEKDARASALRIMLRNTDIEVTVSGIPYFG